MGKPRNSDSPAVSVLFVCLGNICRSTMAEGVFGHLYAQSDLSKRDAVAGIDSCGTGAYHSDEPPDDRTLSVLKEHGITNYTHGARRVNTNDFKKFDYILAMDRYNLRDLRKMRRSVVAKGGSDDQLGRVELFGHFGIAEGEEDEEVIDPYYGGRDGFEKAYTQMLRFSNGLLEEVRSVTESTA